MDNLLFIDTETSDRYNFKAPPCDSCQPHIVQIAALLCDPRGRELATLATLIRPEGWTIATEAQKVHGITLEECDGLGLRIMTVIRLMNHWAERCGMIVAHSVSFDAGMMDCEGSRFFQEPKYTFAPHAERRCTMEIGTPLCKLPGKYGNYKWPKLTELHQHLFGESFDGAHGAMADVQACKRCYFAMCK